MDHSPSVQNVSVLGVAACSFFFFFFFFGLFVDQDRGGLPALTTSALARFLRQAYVILMILILAWRTWTYRAYASRSFGEETDSPYLRPDSSSLAEEALC
jgi:hypothetical protein